MIFENMDMERLDDYAELFVSVFNSPPWNDRWTLETARLRLGELMSTETFAGKSAVESGEIIGIILGQREHFFDGLHFQIQEFCVKTESRNCGCGTRLLAELKDELNKQGVVNIYLITQRGESTEGYYLRRGFKTSEKMIVMSEKSK